MRWQEGTTKEQTMRIVCSRQQTEEWDCWRNRPTASEFAKFITPVTGKYSSQARGYAAKIVAKRLGVYTEPPPTFWMDWGDEQEPNAKHAYTAQTGRKIVDVGFVLPDHTDAFGCSPDGLVGDDGLIEIKCPAPETLISYHATSELPDQYRPQIQGQLLVTDRKWCDFFVFHPQLTPYLIRIDADHPYQGKIAECLIKLLAEIERIEASVSTMQHKLVNPTTTKSDVRWTDE
jgi:putative phage-type endonuclease